MKNNVMQVPCSKCSGCSACMNVCPVNAITMKEDEEGFFMPCVDEDVCIDCGKCFSICPEMNTKYDNDPSPKIIAAMAKSDVRMKSSSGGMFTLFAEYFFEQGGYVCGAVFDDDFRLSHIMTGDPSQLDRLRGSKYVQSSTGFCYRDVKTALEQESKVLFTGTPCQVAGLKAFLGKDYDGLYTVDILCHGVPSQKLFDRYLSETIAKLDEDGNKRRLNKVLFRDKKIGWKCQTMHLGFENADDYEKSLTDGDMFEFIFHRNMALRKSCSNCPFAEFPRQGDISMGDFWGISKIDKSMLDKKGTSLVTINSAKGEQLFASVSDRLKRYKQINMAPSEIRNRVRADYPANEKRTRFMELLRTHSLEKSVSFIKTDHFDVGLVSNFYAGNFGGAMTQIALYHVLEDMGYSTLMIERPKSTKGAEKVVNNLNTLFLERPYPDYAISPLYNTKAEMRALNDRCDTFVVGSDQLFQYSLFKLLGEFVTLDWVSDSKKKIAYAASFGHDKIWGDPKLHSEMGYFMQKFDAFSVREESGVKIAKENYGVDAEWVLDPVFLCDPRHYHALAARSKRTMPEHYIGGYVLDPSEEKQRIFKAAMERMNKPCEIFSEYNAAKEYLAPLGDLNVPELRTEERLQNIINCDFFITDSFHGTCFSIIMRRPFITIMNKLRGASRFKSLLSMLHLEDRLIESESDLDRPGLFDPIDYDSVHEILNKERSRCRQWLLEALLQPKLKVYSDYDIMQKLTRGKSGEDYEMLLRRIEEQDQQIQALKHLIMNITGNISESLSDKVDIIDYLEAVRNNKKGNLIVVSVKDTPGLNLDNFIAHELMDTLGIETDLQKKHSRSYIAVIDDGRVVYENLGDDLAPSVFRDKLGDYELYVTSRVYRNGNESVIQINDTDYSVNKRGLNIVVFSKKDNSLVDSVCFDTHLKNSPFSR